ncbi:hypothetical protein GALL_492430 [mine drainage metagenome]|uniref:Uncharacterized protein n=1 Tax=mine drainage metagenome TaxID=410659 RepID=A0A1J5PZV1_9ZZZZ
MLRLVDDQHDRPADLVREVRQGERQGHAIAQAHLGQVESDAADIDLLQSGGFRQAGEHTVEPSQVRPHGGDDDCARVRASVFPEIGVHHVRTGLLQRRAQIFAQKGRFAGAARRCKEQPGTRR